MEDLHLPHGAVGGMDNDGAILNRHRQPLFAAPVESLENIALQGSQQGGVARRRKTGFLMAIVAVDEALKILAQFPQGGKQFVADLVIKTRHVGDLADMTEGYLRLLAAADQILPEGAAGVKEKDMDVDLLGQTGKDIKMGQRQGRNPEQGQARRQSGLFNKGLVDGLQQFKEKMRTMPVPVAGM